MRRRSFLATLLGAGVALTETPPSPPPLPATLESWLDEVAETTTGELARLSRFGVETERLKEFG